MTTSPDPRLDAVLRSAGARIDAADARVLLAHVLQRAPAWLFAHADAPLDAAARERFHALVDRREHGEPVAYLTGHRGFWTFDLMVSPDTLIPRADTERLVELALERAADRDGLRIADLGTGSGAIALALAAERPRAHVVAVDVSAAALAVARANAAALGLGHVVFRHGDWLASLAGERFHLIASNPPYIAEDDPHLGSGDLRHEPLGALASGREGFDAIEVIARGAPAHLHRDGWLLLEHGWTQGEGARARLGDAGFEEIATHRDLEDRDRVTLGRWPR